MQIRLALEWLREAEGLAERLNDDGRRGRVYAFMTTAHNNLGELMLAEARGRAGARHRERHGHERRRRPDRLHAPVEGLSHAIADGVDVRGYLHWTLLDNFEWTAVFKMTFGLIVIHRASFARTVKPSARWLGEVARQRPRLNDVLVPA